MKQNLLKSIAAGLLVVAMLAGCAGTDASSTPPAAPSAESSQQAPQEEQAPAGEVVFKYWGAEQKDIMEQISNEFMEKNEGITVTPILEANDQYWTKLITSIAAKKPTADVCWLNPTYAAQMMGTNQLVSVTDLYDSGKIDKSKFTNAAIGSYTGHDDGEIYGVPKDFQTVCLIYNKSIFDEVGVDYPTDDWKWDDVIAASQKIVKTDANGDITRYGFVHNASVMSSWFVYCYANGGSLFDPDNNGGNYVNTPENVEAFQWAADMIFKYNVSPDATETTETVPDTMFINEMVAMTTYVPSQLENYTKVLGDKVAVAQFPYNTQKATITNCLGYGIAAGSENIEASKVFLTYLASKEGQEPQSQIIIPAYQGIVSAMEEKFSDMNFKAYIDSGSYAVPTPVERYSGNASRKALETEISNIMFGTKDVATALADAEKAVREAAATAKAEQGK